MSAWARSRREDAVYWSVALLDEMEDLWKAGDGDIRPSRAAYKAALNALSKLGTNKSARCRVPPLEDGRALSEWQRRVQ